MARKPTPPWTLIGAAGTSRAHVIYHGEDKARLEAVAASMQEPANYEVMATADWERLRAELASVR